MSSSVIKPFKETGEHSYHRRCFTHDYFAPFIYHIILKKSADCEWFGSVTGDAKIAPGNSGCAILITHEAFTDRFKPAAHDFELCAAGSLLIISLGLPAGTTLSRSHCLAMNALAEAIAEAN